LIDMKELDILLLGSWNEEFLSLRSGTQQQWK